jgi:hypothetical protein
MGVIMTGSTPSAAPVERLAIPEDDTAPDTPLQVLLEGDLETSHPDHTSRAYLLGTCQFGGLVGEEELMAPLLPTSAVSF